MTSKRHVGPVLLERPKRARRSIRRAQEAIPVRRLLPPLLRRGPVAIAAVAAANPGPDCYVDYARILTPEGGILITYKDLDLRWRHTLWRVSAWAVATGAEGCLLFHRSPAHGVWTNFLLLPVMGVINWLIVKKPVEVYRRIEIRPDCMILEGADVFWLQHMDGGLPSLQPDEHDNLILSGIYGTRLVEYATLRRFDELDRSPEVFGAHLQAAMQQLWTAT